MTDEQAPAGQYIEFDPVEVAMAAMQGMLSNPGFMMSDGSINTKMIGILSWEMVEQFRAGLLWQQEIAQTMREMQPAQEVETV